MVRRASTVSLPFPAERSTPNGATVSHHPGNETEELASFEFDTLVIEAHRHNLFIVVLIGIKPRDILSMQRPAVSGDERHHNP